MGYVLVLIYGGRSSRSGESDGASSGENIIPTPGLALDAAYKLAQFTHHKKGDAGKKSAKGDAAKKAANRFAVHHHPDWW